MCLVVTCFSGIFAFPLFDLLVLTLVIFSCATALFVLHIRSILCLFSIFFFVFVVQW